MNAPTSLMLPLAPPPSNHFWFSGVGCVVEEAEGYRHVFVGGTLIGSFGPKDRAARNALLMGLCEEPTMHLTKLARAFGVAFESLRLMRAQCDEEGLEAVLARAPGREAKVSEAERVRLEAMFEQGASVSSVMRGRWRQENGFKHGVERWGINQLDGRKTEPYAADTRIVNPARRRLDRAMRIARTREGNARRELAAREENDPRRERWATELELALEQQRELLALRPETPTHAPLSETELAGKLVKHTGDYKRVIDTVRIACANAESELAYNLGSHMARPAEAKRALANLLQAPGRVRVGTRTIAVALHPAGNANERGAMAELLITCNRRGLTLPGDPRARRLRFKLQSL